MVDTLAVARQLADGGVARPQAEAIAGAIGQAVERGEYVTADQFRAALAELRAEIAELRAEQRTAIAELRAEIAELRTEQRTGTAGVRAEIADVRTEIGHLETRLIRWMVATVIAAVTLTVGILRLVG